MNFLQKLEFRTSKNVNSFICKTMGLQTWFHSKSKYWKIWNFYTVPLWQGLCTDHSFVVVLDFTFTNFCSHFDQQWGNPTYYTFSPWFPTFYLPNFQPFLDADFVPAVPLLLERLPPIFLTLLEGPPLCFLKKKSTKICLFWKMFLTAG